MITLLTPARWRYWLPALISSAAAWLVFVGLGATPIVRASGLAVCIAGMTMALRPFGSALAVLGGLALAFSPAFWTQTGGADSLDLWATLAAVGLAGAGAGLVIWLSKRPLMGATIALVIFAVIFFAALGTPRSLRLTTVVAAWLLYVLTDALHITHPRPDEPASGHLEAHHPLALLLLFAIGIVNDPLISLWLPALALGLFLTRQRMPLWYWALLALISAVGMVGMFDLYIQPDWWGFPIDTAEQLGLRVPFLLGGGWYEPERWLRLLTLIGGQFSVVGVVLGVLGLARLARWYPPVGVVTMIAYGAYGLFGLLYYGADAPVLLLPLLMIQLMWLTYAVYTFMHWLRKGVLRSHKQAAWFAPAAFALLPLALLAQQLGWL